MVAWGIFTIVIAVLLMVGVERLMARIGVRRNDPAPESRGIEQLAEALQRWVEARGRKP